MIDWRDFPDSHLIGLLAEAPHAAWLEAPTIGLLVAQRRNPDYEVLITTLLEGQLDNDSVVDVPPS